MSDFVIGIDLGGTKIEVCLLDEQRTVLNRVRVSSESDSGTDRVLDNTLKVIRETCQGRAYRAVGIGTPGTYVPAEDRLYGVPHTPVYEEPGFMGSLRARLDVPLVIDNDANCLAIAEFFASCAGKYRFVMAVILGTGMGSGLILDNKLYHGAQGAAGEIGHTSVAIDGRVCQCGRRGCGEAYLSGPSLSRRYLELTGKQATAEEIDRLQKSGDETARRLLAESSRIMGELFANVVNAFDLEAIILGGGVSNIDVWYQQVPEHLNRALFGPPHGEVTIIRARLGDSAGVVGAGYIALREIGAMDF